MPRPRVLSICCGMGLLDRAFLDAGFDVVAGCEIDPDQRGLHRQLCGTDPLVEDIADLPAAVRGESFDGIIGGPPCQSNTKLRAMRKPKFADLSPEVEAVMRAVTHRWFLFENVAPVQVVGAKFAHLNAMHYGRPHQSRRRCFTFSPCLTPSRCTRARWTT